MLKKVLVLVSIFFIGLKIEPSDSIKATHVTPFSYQPDFTSQRSEQGILDLIIPDCIEVPKEEISGGSVLINNSDVCISCGSSIAICLCNYYATDSLLIPTAQSMYSVFLAYGLATQDQTANKKNCIDLECLGHSGGFIGLPLCTYYTTGSCLTCAAQPVVSLLTSGLIERCIPYALGLGGYVPTQRVSQEDPKKMQ